jgi:hypothetical protein
LIDRFRMRMRVPQVTLVSAAFVGLSLIFILFAVADAHAERRVSEALPTMRI